MQALLQEQQACGVDVTEVPQSCSNPNAFLDLLTRNIRYGQELCSFYHQEHPDEVKSAATLLIALEAKDVDEKHLAAHFADKLIRSRSDQQEAWEHFRGLNDSAIQEKWRSLNNATNGKPTNTPGFNPPTIDALASQDGTVIGKVWARYWDDSMLIDKEMRSLGNQVQDNILHYANKAEPQDAEPISRKSSRGIIPSA